MKLSCLELKKKCISASIMNFSNNFKDLSHLYLPGILAKNTFFVCGISVRFQRYQNGRDRTWRTCRKLNKSAFKTGQNTAEIGQISLYFKLSNNKKTLYVYFCQLFVSQKCVLDASYTGGLAGMFQPPKPPINLSAAYHNQILKNIE